PTSSLCSFLFSSLPPPPTAIYTLSLHDALPIFRRDPGGLVVAELPERAQDPAGPIAPSQVAERVRLEHDARRGPPAPGIVFKPEDRKSTRLNSSHVAISYAVFCLKKKKNIQDQH